MLLKYKNKNFPYPVLSPFTDDYVGDNFKIDFDFENNNEHVNIETNLKLSSEYINELITRGKAKFALRIECSKSRYRRNYTFKSRKFTVNIDAGMIEGLVRLSPFIICTSSIDDYNCDMFHEDYGDRLYALNSGDIIAVTDEIKFYPNKDKDPLEKVTSMFKFCLNYSDNPSTAYDVDHGGNYVKILMSESSHKILQTLTSSKTRNKNIQHILSAKFIVPTLIYLIDLLELSEADEYESYRWYHVLKRRLDELGYDINDLSSNTAVKLAQEIINDPVTSSMSVLEEQFLGGDYSE